LGYGSCFLLVFYYVRIDFGNGVLGIVPHEAESVMFIGTGFIESAAECTDPVIRGGNYVHIQPVIEGRLYDNAYRFLEIIGKQQYFFFVKRVYFADKPLDALCFFVVFECGDEVRSVSMIFTSSVLPHEQQTVMRNVTVSAITNRFIAVLLSECLYIHKLHHIRRYKLIPRRIIPEVHLKHGKVQNIVGRLIGQVQQVENAVLIFEINRHSV